MNPMPLKIVPCLFAWATALPLAAREAWVVDSQDDWMHAVGAAKGLVLEDGLAMPAEKRGVLTSRTKRYDKQRKARSMTFDQSPIWQNWEPIANLGPVNMRDAPVFLSLGPGNYWAFGLYAGAGKDTAFSPQLATLEGFEGIELLTTPFPDQFDAPGGLQKSLGGYHAWQSADMVNWVHHGPVTEGFSRWVTSAEHVDGKTYLFYDFPNDQDPHAYEDEDLTDGRPGRNLGLAFKDPSHGSDAAFIRDLEGAFHVFYEDWSPIDASSHSWDSPLAGHAVSKTPVGGYQILPPAIDHRTRDTGRDGQYLHPHWTREDPANFPSNVARYDIHEPEQNAYGDWAAIAIGGRYYLFGDYHPANSRQLSVGWFTSDALSKPFTWCDAIGKGHPDPDIGFAKGRFYLFTQQDTDYVSDGPWVERVQARLGVDTDNDGRIDQWTGWQHVKETYNYIEGFSKQVSKTPAKLDVQGLPAGFGFAFQVRMTDTTGNRSKPMLDRLTIDFE